MKVLENTVVGYRRERKWFGESKLGHRWIMLASGKSSDLVGVTEVMGWVIKCGKQHGSDSE